MEEDAKIYIVKMLLSIQDEYDTWEPLQTSADERAYQLLGHIYELGQAVDTDLTSRRYELEEAVKGVNEIRESKKWSPGGKPATELIVTYLLGIRTKRSRKHNWVTVLSEAAADEVDAKQEAFIEWIEKQKGIEGVLDRRAGKDPSTGPSVSDIVKSLKPAQGAIQVPLSLGSSVVAVLVATRNDDETFTVVHTETREAQVRKVLIDCGLAGQRKKREPTEVAIRKIEAKALSAMVRITLRIAGKGAIRKGDEDRFMNAKNLLAKFPALSEKYFTKTPAVHARPPDHFGKGGEITVQNETFDVLDPGRFIGGAKEGTLIPFPFTPGDKTANTAAANAYLEALKRPPKEECEPNPDPANLGAFIDSSETLESA